MHYNQVNNFNLIKLEELLEFYQVDKDNSERAGKDYIKIELLNEIISRLKSNPRPDIIKPSLHYEEIDVNKIKKLGQLNSLLPSSPLSPSQSDIMTTPRK